MSRLRWLIIICVLLFAWSALPAAAFTGVNADAVKKAAEEGNADAQVELGVMYSQGLGVPVADKAEAVKWYEKSAQQGNATGQYNLGVMYMRGEGVEQDYAKGREWIRKAADQGIPAAQFDLAYCLSKGLGGEVDQDEALALIRKAADQGYRQARKVLQDYEDGRQPE